MGLENQTIMREIDVTNKNLEEIVQLVQPVLEKLVQPELEELETKKKRRHTFVGFKATLSDKTVDYFPYNILPFSYKYYPKLETYEIEWNKDINELQTIQEWYIDNRHQNKVIPIETIQFMVIKEKENA